MNVNRITRLGKDVKCFSFKNMLQGKYELQHEQSEEFQQELKLKVRQLLTDQEWRRRKMAMRVCLTELFSFR